MMSCHAFPFKMSCRYYCIDIFVSAGTRWTQPYHARRQPPSVPLSPLAATTVLKYCMRSAACRACVAGESLGIAQVCMLVTTAPSSTSGLLLLCL